MNSSFLSKSYVPYDVEKRWYDFWESEKLFVPEKVGNNECYSIVLPPPNITGALHMGHALNGTLQDVLCRYRRIKGDRVLWIPGTDHAGIATQNVVERKNAEDGFSRHDLGRSEFIRSVWKWKKTYGETITGQMKRLGLLCNWDEERFTMDEGISIAVREAFVRLYQDGLIYRGNYIINWCTRCCTALSDLEVEHKNIDSYIYEVKYPYADNSDGIIVATTRPETILGDTAIAVHPKDDRYHGLKIKNVTLPLLGRKIPIIEDEYVDRSFGTGALKVTPAHDPNDFEIGLRHNLPSIKVIDDNGIMNSNAGRFQGLDRYKCREEILKALKNEGLLIETKMYNHSIGHCYRCKTVVEPSLSKQWFVRTKSLAERAIKAVRDGETHIIPSLWTKTYYDWMLNIKDWCISRQIWWGHRIPAWTCEQCNNLLVDVNDPIRCPKCGCDNLYQDPDVLDTWFSSSLWPFSTMGWPEKNNLLDTYYPTSVLITGFDILFFWVARMMMMGLYFTKQSPFRDVYVHALVRDEEGKKMSKSKGNVVDPIKIIDKYGTDAFRFTLIALANQGRDIRMSEKRVDGYRNFVNKLWNASRFSLMYLEKGYDDLNFDGLTTADFWILSKFGKLNKNVSISLDAYKFNEAADYLYKFVWHEFCDWYLESIKSALYGKHGEIRERVALSVLWFVLRDILVLLHPFLPFVTEEIWHRFPGVEGSILKANYPEPSTYCPGISIFHYKHEKDMNFIIDLVTNIRNVRSQINIPLSVKLDVVFQADNSTVSNLVNRNTDLIIDLAKLGSLVIDSSEREPKFAATAFIGNSTIFVLLKGVINFSEEKLRLEKEINKLSEELTGICKKLSNEDFLNKAPKHIVDKVKEKHNIFIEKRNKIETTLSRIKEISEF